MMIDLFLRWEAVTIAASFALFWWGIGGWRGFLPALKGAAIVGAVIILIPAFIRGAEKLEQRQASYGKAPDREICTPTPFGCD